MRCLRCGLDNDYRTRSAHNGACAGCGRRFVFEPRKGDPLTDGAFAAAIAAVSEDGRLAWLDRQLYFEIARRIRRRRFLHRITRRARVSIDGDAFTKLLSRWVAGHGEPSGRLAPNAFATDRWGNERAADATEHGFDRLVVCDSERTADVLLANGFHADHRCAVLAVSGYPAWAYALLMPGFRETPPALVAVVHDADSEGCRLEARVRTDPNWFGGVEQVSIVDAGLRPADAARFRGLYLPGSAVDVLREPVTVDEAKWLSKHRLELAAARPRILMNVLASALNPTPEASRAPVGEGDTWTWPGLWVGGGDGSGDDGVG